MPNAREIFGALTREELLWFSDTFNVSIDGSRSRAHLVDRLEAAKLPLSDLLLSLTEERLKEICRTLCVSDTGREKTVIVARILDVSGYREAQVRIRDCRVYGNTTLDLSSLGLTSLPPEIVQLTHLSQLFLDKNMLVDFPREILDLPRLDEVYLGGNHMTALTPELGRMTALKFLSIENNRLQVLPREIGQVSELQILDLSKNRIAVLPPEIGRLCKLQALVLHNNRLAILPAELGQLKALTRLYLRENPIEFLPPEIGQLPNLTHLRLSDAKLTSLPAEIGQLSSLEEMYLSSCGLNSIPPEIGCLSALSVLNLDGNRLSSLPVEIGQLKRLHTLNCNSNGVAALPEEVGQLPELTRLSLVGNRLKTLPKSLRQLSRLRELFLHGNDLKLSPSILGPDPRVAESGFASARSILDYYFAARDRDSSSLNEVKVILVGRGGVGKTSTVRALRGLPFEKDEKSTSGIALCDLVLDGCKGEPVTAHVWDFAGQVITHALHQFFFSIRSVYVLVLSGRENNEREDAEYWLRLIRAFGTDDSGQGPPVVVALNKWDMAGCRPRVDQLALKERYPFICGFVELDCKTKRGVVALNKMICAEVSRLKWVREPFPAAWATIRKALTRGRRKKAHLPYGEYRALCSEHGLADEGEQDSLAEVLHNLGSALNYRRDPRLREATVLQPEWLTRNVYGLVRRAEKYSGVLGEGDIDVVLRREPDPQMRRYLVQIMERFEIAYASRSSGTPIWLVPQALPDEQPEGVERFRDAKEPTQLRYTYQSLPEGLLARAIVRLHPFIREERGKPLQWASGAVLVREGAEALLRRESPLQVKITVTGPLKARQQLAGLCRAEMRDIHSEIPGLEVLEETNIQGAWISTEILEADERSKRPTGVPVPNVGTVMVDPEGPNNAYSEKAARQADLWKPTVFICYSKKNVVQRKRLELELKVLCNEGLLDGHWHDRMIDPGDEWDPKIQRELDDADVIVVLASSDALATDYITRREIPRAMELHKEGKAVVVPVILEKCRWDKTALGALNALPEKAKPINTWKPQANAWSTVADGLAQVLVQRVEAISWRSRLPFGTHEQE